MADRIQEIIDAAERVAEAIRADAEADAARHIEARWREAQTITEESAQELTRSMEVLADHARRLHRESELMLRAVDNALARVGAATTTLPPEPASPGGEPAEAVAESGLRVTEGPAGPRRVVRGVETLPSDRVGSNEPPRGAGWRQSHGNEEALLRATQMAVAGNSRTEIEITLHDELGIATPGPIVDQILGPGGG